MAVADARYRFTMVNVGAYGKDTDGSILCNTNFHQRQENGTLKLPTETKLSDSDFSAFLTIIFFNFPLFVPFWALAIGSRMSSFAMKTHWIGGGN